MLIKKKEKKKKRQETQRRNSWKLSKVYTPPVWTGLDSGYNTRVGPVMETLHMISRGIEAAFSCLSVAS